MSLIRFYLIINFLFIATLSPAQNKLSNITFHITGSDNNKLENISVQIQGDKFYESKLTDKNGEISFQLPDGKYEVQISHLSFHDKKIKIDVSEDKKITIALKLLESSLEEVVITAKESKGLSTKSIINRKTMEHLQPSSFADLMELVPGGRAKDPVLTSPNPVLIREFGQSKYNTGSLGVLFLMDGNPINSNADLQISSLGNQIISSGYADSKRYTANIGVDMRTLSTNDIKSVEIIRGIPSASYGDLTSGLILINRKSGKTPWEGRIKADGLSKSYYIAKGFSINKSWDLNVSFDYLDAKADPRDTYENYKRITSSIRSVKKFNIAGMPLLWNANLDYISSIDSEKFDPDTGYEKVDSYKSSIDKISFTNNFNYDFTKGSLFKNISLNTNIRQGIENLNQVKFVQHSGPRSVSIATEEGENEGYFPEISYVSYFRTEGRPLDIYTKLITNMEFNTFEKINHNIELGTEWKYSKNNGRGQIYDVLKPPSPSMTTRPRSYKDIPAFQDMSFFIGDRLKYDIANNKFTLYAGVRVSKMLGMDKSYALSNKIFTEPRINFQWGLPNMKIGNQYLKTDITIGYGELYKQPTLLMLYPNKRYLDFQQLNFYHDKEEFRYVNYMTYIKQLENKELSAAKNIKKEIRLDLSYANHNIFFTYFNEKMTTGFRQSERFESYTYKRYDASGIDLDHMTGPPDVSLLPYETRHVFVGYTINENGSNTFKEGIEFGYSSPRFPIINTRFTLSGAWFKTIYSNSEPFHYMPNVSLAGKDYPYVGIYLNDEGYNNSGLNYNLIVDTYLPLLDMNISASFQGTWFYIKKKIPKIPEPYEYYDKDGNVYPFLEEDKKDLYKQWLVRNVSVTDNLETRYTFDLIANLKVSKRIYNNIKASLFVNRLFSYYQPYYFNEVKVKRKDESEPYFGMELNFNF